MELYHGSPNRFDKFDYSKIGQNGTSEGFGFYFTDKKSIAANYAENAYMYTVQLTGKKLSGNKRTITKSQYIKLAKYLHEQGEYLSNYGEVEYDGLETVLSYAVEGDWKNSDSDAELIGGIINAHGSVEEVCQAVYDVLGYGYIVDNSPSWGNVEGNQTVYVALVNDVVDVVSVEKLKDV